MKPRMAFFVEQEHGTNNKQIKEPDRVDLELIAIGKRTGLSLSELNEFRVQDLLDYSNIYTGKKDDGSRTATQNDIDKLLL